MQRKRRPRDRWEGGGGRGVRGTELQLNCGKVEVRVGDHERDDKKGGADVFIIRDEQRYKLREGR